MKHSIKSSTVRLNTKRVLLNRILLSLLAITVVSYICSNANQLNDNDMERSRIITAEEEEDVQQENSLEGKREEFKKDDEIVYASFGTSVTWGASLKNREADAYVRLLSQGNPERGRNFGMRSSGPNYPAACIHSMVGDQEFDVIISEYFMRCNEGVMTFVSRLRERFPKALIILVQLWWPGQYKSVVNSRVNIGSWAIQEKGFGKDFIHDPKFPDALTSHGEDKWKNFWHFPETPQNQCYQNVSEKMDAHIVKLPFASHATGPDGWIELGKKFFADDSFHLSEGGHAMLADQIKEIVDKVGIPKERTVGNFRGKDSCNNWFETGEIGDDIKYSPNGVVAPMPNTKKYVLSFEPDAATGDDSGWIEISNPSDEVMDLFVSYMTTGPPPSKYPAVEVTRGNFLKSKFTLDPDSTGWGEKEVHVTRLTQIGHMNPGALNERIYFKPLEKIEYPFRLISVALTPVNTNELERFSSILGGNLND